MILVLTFIAFIVIFSALVLIHELGHFITAKKAGIKVEEFGFGLPPRIWGIKKGEVLYSLNAIPFGGFVRLLGEDAKSAKVLKNPRSFISKSPRVRIMVVLAGVAMNFILAIVLLTIGFSLGMKPLISSPEDVYVGIDSGVIQIEQGVQIKEVVTDSPAALAGLKAGDKLLKIDGKTLQPDQDFAMDLKKNEVLNLEVLNLSGQTEKIEFVNNVKNQTDSIKLYDFFYIPRLIVDEVGQGFSGENGLQVNDVMLQVNGKNIYTQKDFSDAVAVSSKGMDLLVLRNNQKLSLHFVAPVVTRIVLTEVAPGSPAEIGGLQAGDKIVAVDGTPVYLPNEMMTVTHKAAGKPLIFSILRGGNGMLVNVIPNNEGLIGVSLAQISPYQSAAISFYSKLMPSSILKINDVKFPFWLAPIEAIKETGRLSVITVETFAGVIKSIFTKFAVPDGVAGPVGIFQMTGTFVQEGAVSVLRFMALLSLSLGIINVLPIPALDGGRLLFIVVEVIIGRKVNGRLESMLHALGFAFLILLILMVTYSDILKLF